MFPVQFQRQGLRPERAGFGVALKLSVAVVANAFFLGLFIASASPGDVVAAFRGARPEWLVLGVLAVGAAHAARAQRWAVMLRNAGAEVRFRDTAVPLVGAVALNNLLPLGAGDAVRMIALQSFAGRPSARQLGTLALEERLDLAAPVVIALASLLAWRAAPAGAGLAAPPALLAAAATGAFLWGAAGACGRDPSRGRIPPAGLAAIAGLTAAAWLAEALGFLAAAEALGLDRALPAAVLGAGLVGLSRAVPALPGHLGAFDYFAAAAAAAFGAGPGQAAAYALLSHALVWIPATAVGWRLLASAARIGVARGPMVRAA